MSPVPRRFCVSTAHYSLGIANAHAKLALQGGDMQHISGPVGGAALRVHTLMSGLVRVFSPYRGAGKRPLLQKEFRINRVPGISPDEQLQLEPTRMKTTCSNNFQRVTSLESDFATPLSRGRSISVPSRRLCTYSASLTMPTGL